MLVKIEDPKVTILNLQNIPPFHISLSQQSQIINSYYITHMNVVIILSVNVYNQGVKCSSTSNSLV